MPKAPIHRGDQTMKISRVEEMRALDRAAIERYGIADALSMENVSAGP